MIETLQNFDADLLLALNGAHNGYFDHLMWLVSCKWAWVPMTLVLLYVLWTKGWRQAVTVLLAVALVIVIADQVSSSIIKPLVERLRPTHNPQLANAVHVVNGYRGGMYGFVSSHAANHFGVAVLLALMLRRRNTSIVLPLWALLAGYSRIYLGVHYPGDVFCGAVVGCLAAWLTYALWRRAEARWLHTGSEQVFQGRDAAIVATAAVLNVALLAVLAAVGV